MPSCAIFFSSFALAGNTCIHVSCYLLVLCRYRANLLLHFQIQCSSSSWKFCLGFFLVNSECDAYLPVNHSLVCNQLKLFLLFFSLILSLRSSFSVHIWVSFCFLLQNLVNCGIGILSSTFPSS